MNKKFSTLMALALLAGSLPVAAGNNTKWIPVTPEQLVNGAEYRIMKGDSLLVDSMSTKTSVMEYAVDAPVFSGKNSAEPSVWTLTKESNGFSLKASSHAIRNVNGELYSNTDDNKASLVLNPDSTMSIDGVSPQLNLLISEVFLPL